MLSTSARDTEHCGGDRSVPMSELRYKNDQNDQCDWRIKVVKLLTPLTTGSPPYPVRFTLLLLMFECCGVGFPAAHVWHVGTCIF